MTDFTVQHLKHITSSVSNPAGPTQISNEATVIGEGIPHNLTYDIPVDGISSVTYDLPTENTMVRWSQTEPYVSDFMLQRNGINFIGGLHTEVELEANGTMVSIAGLDWKHWLEKQHYPFDLPDVATDFGPVYQYDTPVSPLIILIEIIQEVMLDAVAPFGAGWRYAGVEYYFSQTGLIDIINDIATMDYYEIPYGDEQSIYDKCQELSKRDDGFDWDVDANRVVRAWIPYRGRDMSHIVLDDGTNITNTKLRNPGIAASRTFATGQGDAQRDIKLGEHSGSTSKWRRLDQFVDVGDVFDETELQKKADNEDLRATHGIEQITADVITDNFDFHQLLQIGDVVLVRFPTVYYPSGYYYDQKRIINIHGEVNNEGTETISLTFDSSHLAYA